MSFSFGGSSTKEQAQSQQQNDVPEWLRTAYQQNLARATNTADSAFTPYTGAINATDNTLYRDARSTIQQAQGAGQGQTGVASDVYSQIAQQSPYFFEAAQTGDILDVSPERASAGSLATTGLSPYMNPYQSAVIDQSNAEIERQRQMAQNQNAYSASQAGAFGGSRHGIVDAENNRNFARIKQDNTNSLLQSGYAQAQAAAQADIDRQAGISQFNAGQMNAAQTQNANLDYTARNADSERRQAAAIANAGIDQANTQANLQAAQGLLAAGQQQQNLMLNQAQALAGAGDNIRAAQQAQYDADYGEFLRWQNDPFNKQQLANSAVFGIPSQSLQSTTGFNKSSTNQMYAGANGTLTDKVLLK